MFRNKNNQNMQLKDYLQNNLMSLFFDYLSFHLQSEEKIFQVVEEMEIISDQIEDISQLMVDSFFDMEGTVKIFEKKF